MFRNPDVFIPSLTNVLDEFIATSEFSLNIESLEVLKKIDPEVGFALKKLTFNYLVNRVECECHESKDYFILLFKAFYAETKYVKLVFNFSISGRFIGVFVNNLKVDHYSPYFRKNLTDFLSKRIEYGRKGILLENEFDSFLHLFQERNDDCIGFENVSSAICYDSRGVDFFISFQKGIMPIQLKGRAIYSRRHHKLHPRVALIIIELGEDYAEIEKKVLLKKESFLVQSKMDLL
ncbi:MAG: hypothetical protein ABH951_02630 [Patescibacteria group bacterium]